MIQSGHAMKAILPKKGARQSVITLDVEPITQERLSASEFLELAKTNPSLIKSSRAVLPTPGRTGFGSILVTYTHPRYKTTG